MVNTLILLAMGLVLTVNPPVIPQHGESALHPRHFADRFVGVPFAGKLGTLMTHLGKVTSQRFAARMTKTSNDPHARDRLQAEIGVTIQQIRDSNISFIGQNTGYNVSIVCDEFAHNSGESMTVMPQGRSHDYFFFIKGNGLWKIVTTDVSKQRFAVFLLQQTQRFGAAKEVEYDDPSTRERPIRARWVDERFIVEARSRPDYGAITITWSALEVGNKIVQLRGKNKPPSDNLGTELDPDILDIMRD